MTAAGPHAGDKSPSRTVPRLKVEITTLVHMHSSLLVSYSALLVGLAFGLLAVRATRATMLRLTVLLALVFAQAGWARRSTSPGCPQFWSPFTSPALRPARQPPRRCGRRCASGQASSRAPDADEPLL